MCNIRNVLMGYLCIKKEVMDFFNSLIFMLMEMAPYILAGFLVAGMLHAFVPEKLMARHLSGGGVGPTIKAALLGIPLPLCSCGVLPAAIALRRGGASKAASTSFLIATPQTGVDSIAATWSLLGPAFAVIRPVAALVTSLFGGLAVGAAEGERATDAGAQSCAINSEPEKSFVGKCVDALRYGFVDLVGSIGLWLVIGLVIAALITVYVPDSYFTFLGNNPLLSMLAVLIVAVPMYVCATGSIPIAMSLMLKGLSPGTALVLLMAGPAANFASFTLISREMGRRAAWVYLGSIVAGAICFGLIIDWLLPAGWFLLPHASEACCGVHGASLFSQICAAVLALLLIWAILRNYIFNNRQKTNNMTKNYKITGMNCPHCQATVKSRIEAVDGVTGVDVSLSSGIAAVEGVHDAEALVAAVRAAGFEASEIKG